MGHIITDLTEHFPSLHDHQAIFPIIWHYYLVGHLGIGPQYFGKWGTQLSLPCERSGPSPRLVQLYNVALKGEYV